jgi:hypothetical protein
MAALSITKDHLVLATAYADVNALAIEVTQFF